MLALVSKTASHKSHMSNELLLDAHLEVTQRKGIVDVDGGTFCHLANQDVAPDVQDGNTKQARFLVHQSLERNGRDVLPQFRSTICPKS